TGGRACASHPSDGRGTGSVSLFRDSDTGYGSVPAPRRRRKRNDTLSRPEGRGPRPPGSRTDGSVGGSCGGRVRSGLPARWAGLEFRGPGILQRRAPERRAGVVGGDVPAGALPMTGAGRQVNRAGRPLLPVKMQVAGLVRNSMPMVTGFVGAPL